MNGIQYFTFSDGFTAAYYSAIGTVLRYQLLFFLSRQRLESYLMSFVNDVFLLIKFDTLLLQPVNRSQSQ